MTRRVITVTPDTPILAAAQLMLEHKISGLPVVDAAAHVVGMVSERDLLCERDDGQMKRPNWLALAIDPAKVASMPTLFRDRKVSEVMTQNPVTISAAAPLEEAGRLIEERGIKRLPVVQDGTLVGVIARADLVRALTKAIARGAKAAEPDVGAIAHLVELERQMFRNRARVRRPF
jgi:CBS domain-containing protein